MDRIEKAARDLRVLADSAQRHGKRQIARALREAATLIDHCRETGRLPVKRHYR